MGGDDVGSSRSIEVQYDAMLQKERAGVFYFNWKLGSLGEIVYGSSSAHCYRSWSQAIFDVLFL